MNLKHNDPIIVTINGEDFMGLIEERMLGQWPDTRTGLFVLVEDDAPRFPIPICHFDQKNAEVFNYGTIKAINNERSNIRNA